LDRQYLPHIFEKSGTICQIKDDACPLLTKLIIAYFFSLEIAGRRLPLPDCAGFYPADLDDAAAVN
jgi:hypothetical protein